MDTVLNSNKNINDFCLNSLMKTETHFIGTFTFIVIKIIFIIKLLSAVFNKTSSLFYRPRLIRNIIRLTFFVPSLGRYKTHFFFAGPARPVRKNHLSSTCPARWKNHSSYVCLAHWKNYPSFAGPARARADL